MSAPPVPAVVLVAAAAIAALFVAATALRPVPRTPDPAPSATTGRSARTPNRRSVPGRAAPSLVAIVVVAIVVVAIASVMALGPLVVALAISVVAAARSARRVASARRRQRSIDAELPDAIDLVVLTMHAGATPTQAVLDVAPHVDGPIRQAFDTVALRLERGQGLADAVTALPELLGPRASGLADAIATAERYGLPLAPVLQGLSDDARADRRRDAEARARSLSVKLSFPLVACTLPSFVLLAIVPAVMGALRSLPTSPIRP